MTDKPIKVLWVTNALGFGGAERQMLYMYDILKNSGLFDITILYYAEVENQLSTEGVKNVFINKREIGMVKTVLSISKFLRDNDIVIMHALGGCSANFYGRAGAIFSRKTTPIGAVLGKKHFKTLCSRLCNSILNLFGNYWTVNNIELIPILKHDLFFLSDKRISLLHNGFVDRTKIDYKFNEHTEYDIETNKHIFCAIGRIEPVKNYTLLVDAASVLASKGYSFGVWIIGDGSEKEKLANRISELNLRQYVRLWGYKTNTDVALSRCNTFVQTSLTEGSPNSMAEAMRAQKPIISTNCTNLSEMIQEDRNGYITKNDNVTSLLEAMEKMLSKSIEQQVNMGKISYELFLKHFCDTVVAKEYSILYSKILENK